ncbi:hypothetical protein BY996DRAFT_4574814 [Phakopsora pachyrhizi]|uniref:Enoyl reductase (ER) domain-containing protein n=1 Tax=Phakopsora pachyrhizi TaxID=170000 RepID=A0AAV0B0Q7_PHAPC|nr:hypothetical protein BY996DRAFT_8561339 [Phakopsora pachyrhizi]KAI8460340.1 hypothetical protein BY996DRAFT_4574814 [Phakopsora pachyrhizi]CAH7676385.1 hypothetical protein PPACK8108_LOCUS11503 [Phakopsora pachyrhizi]
MPLVRNASVKFVSPPKGGYPVEGQHLRYYDSEQIDIETVDLRGGVLLRNLVVSIDPYQRGRMREPEIKSYATPFELSKPIINFGVGRVIRSDNPNFKPGDEIFSGQIGFEEYTVLSSKQLKAHNVRVINSDQSVKIPLSKWVGAAGMPGLTAYHGFYEIGKPQKGEIIFISAASGAVGQMVGQLAKRAGLKVVGSCGSDEKVEFLKKELEFDHVFNYKTCKTLEELQKVGGVDIYWENVGGKTLDDVLLVANKGARIVACGMISQYNASGELYGVKNIIQVIAKSITIRGFIIGDPETWASAAEGFYSSIPKWLASGEIKSKEDITVGLDRAIGTLIGIFKGQNFGKAVVEIWDGK